MSLFSRLLRIHRYLGLVVAAFVLILAITGILLNHTEGFGLDQKQVRSPWLLRLYQIPSPEWQGSFRTGQFTATQWDQTIYLNRQPVATGELLGLVEVDEILLLAAGRELLLLTESAELIDRLPLPEQLPSPWRLGLDQEQRAIIAGGNRAWQSDFDYTDFEPRQKPTTEVAWSESYTPSATELSQAQTEIAGPGLSLERIILDLHSGRIVGLAGVIWMDLVAVLMITLTGTGVWIWWRRRR